jgi:hypothetical protein
MLNMSTPNSIGINKEAVTKWALNNRSLLNYQQLGANVIFYLDTLSVSALLTVLPLGGFIVILKVQTPTLRPLIPAPETRQTLRDFDDTDIESFDPFNTVILATFAKDALDIAFFIEIEGVVPAPIAIHDVLFPARSDRRSRRFVNEDLRTDAEPRPNPKSDALTKIAFA